jgi:hypothetical protein
VAGFGVASVWMNMAELLTGRVKVCSLELF